MVTQFPPAIKRYCAVVSVGRLSGGDAGRGAERIEAAQYKTPHLLHAQSGCFTNILNRILETHSQHNVIPFQ